MQGGCSTVTVSFSVHLLSAAQSHEVISSRFFFGKRMVPNTKDLPIGPALYLRAFSGFVLQCLENKLPLY